MAIRSSRLLLLVCLVVVLTAVAWLGAGIPLHQALESWRGGKPDEAVARLQQWKWLSLRGADYDRLIAAADLGSGREAEAQPYLDSLAGRPPSWFPAVRKGEVGKRLVSAGRYEEFLRYDAAARERRPSPEVALYRAAAQAGLGRIDEADATFRGIDASKVDGAKYAALRSSIDQRRQGSVPLIADATGKPIASYQVAGSDLVPVNPDFAPLVDRSGGALTFEANLAKLGTGSTIATTLDPDVQRAARVALAGFRGSLVAIDVKTNRLLAVANEGGAENLAFAQTYEPGSVVKVLTSVNAFESGIDMAKIFPLQCGGFLVLEGKQFFDWAVHGEVPGLDDALACSCNVSLGKMGLALGAPRIESFMKKAGFNGSVDLGFGPIPLGRVDENVSGDYATANLAIGLGHETISALHLAMIGRMVASGGEFGPPQLILSRKSILGEDVAAAPVAPSVRLASSDSTRKVTEAMKAAVLSPRGTGRRAAVPGLSIALKTGTAGSSAGGYDALVVAFAPADNPRIAIGLIAEHAGPAEFAGAKITHDFFERLAPRLAGN